MNLVRKFCFIHLDDHTFVVVHNTDLNNPISLTKVLYFDQEGKMVKDYLKNEIIGINPLAKKDFSVPYEDQSGTGPTF